MNRMRAIMIGFLFLGLFAVVIIPQSFNYAYGHGLSGDMVTASIGDRDATLRVDMKPSVLLAEAPQDATIEMRLFDTNTDKNIEHVTYLISLYKGDKLLMRDWFHAHDGDLFIKIRPTDQERTVVNAPVEPILNGFLGSRDLPALASGPIFLEGGLYHFATEVFSIDFDQTILDPPIKFDAYVSIGETVTYSMDGAEQEILVRTYYDKVQDFSFDEKNKLVKFSMPMNWDQEFLSQVPLVHEEVVIPKSFTELIAEKYTGVVNGVRLPQSSVMVDTSNPDEVVVHYMITNRQLLQLADHVKAMIGPDANTAEFTLTPGEVDLGMPLEMKMSDSGQMMGSGMMAMSSKGNIHAMLSWSPTTIEPSKTTSFTINFMDMRTGAPITDATYDFILLKDGQEIVKRQGQAIGGVGGEQFTFKESQAGAITLRLENINNTGESADFNIQVVPEFPVGVLAIAGAIIAGMLAIVRFRGLTIANKISGSS